MSNKTLEQKTEKEDWKQLWPVYGFYQSIKDKLKNKPSALDDINSVKYHVHVLYQAVSIALFGIGLYKLVEKL